MTNNIFFYLFKRVVSINYPQLTIEKNSDKFDILEKYQNYEELFTLFCEVQKIYFGFSKLAHIYKFKKATIKNTHDLALNPITNIRPRKTIVFLQDGSLYAMHLTELINIINTSLTYVNPFFILEIYTAKNPYTNIPFNKSILYNIYFAIKQSDYKMPPLFHAFFMCHFNINDFVRNHRHCILEYAIDRFIFNTHYTIIYPYIAEMLKSNSLTGTLNICADFPKDILVDIMRPYLHMYYRMQYSDVSEEGWVQLMTDFTQMMYAFYNYNPKFGRKHISVKRKPLLTHLVTYNTIHPILTNSRFKFQISFC